MRAAGRPAGGAFRGGDTWHSSTTTFCCTPTRRGTCTSTPPAAADPRLPQPSAATDIAENRRFDEPLRDLARRRSLQVARHAGQRRCRALLHRRCRPRTRSSSRGRQRSRTACAIRSITGRTSSCSATSRSTSCSTRLDRRASGSRPTNGSPPTSCARTASCDTFDVKRALHDRRSRGAISPVTRAIRASGLATRVFPTFRPDRALDVHSPEVFNAVGRAARRRGQHRHRPVRRLPRRPRAAAPGLSRRRRTAVRPRPRRTATPMPARDAEAAAIFDAGARRAARPRPSDARPLRRRT